MNKFLIFSMSIIWIIFPSMAFSMNVTWSQRTQEIYAKYLSEQQYSSIMDNLYLLLENSDVNTNVLAWVKKGADEGHVPMMYLILRNYANALASGVVLQDPTMWPNIGKYILLSLIRLYQDEEYCTQSRNERLVAQGYGTWFSISELTCDLYKRNIISAFRDKCAHWFVKYLTPEKISFLDALALAVKWFQDHADSVSRINPLWAKYTYPKAYSPTKKIIFESTDEYVVLKTFVVEREEARTELARAFVLALENDVNNWSAFFSPQTKFSKQVNFNNIQQEVPVRGQQNITPGTPGQQKQNLDGGPRDTGEMDVDPNSQVGTPQQVTPSAAPQNQENSQPGNDVAQPGASTANNENNSQVADHQQNTLDQQG